MAIATFAPTDRPTKKPDEQGNDRRNAANGRQGAAIDESSGNNGIGGIEQLRDD